MKVFLNRLLGRLLRITGLQYWPVRVRSGIAAGARWTLFPWSAYWRGTQEPAFHRALMELGDIRGWSCWDLGAHYGIYAVGLGRKVGPTGAVACFEPNPLSYARLSRHCRMNGLTWVKLFPVAVSDTATTAELYTYGHLENTSTHLRYDEEPASVEAQPLQISTVILDTLVASGEIRLPNFIKVDVEGHGHHALAGAITSIRASLPIIAMGFHSPHEVKGTKELLDPLGYTWHAIEPNASADWTWADVILRPPAAKITS